MPIRTSRIQAKHIKPGKYMFTYVYIEGEFQPLKIRVHANGLMKSRYGNTPYFNAIEMFSRRQREFNWHGKRWSRRTVFLGDRGIRPHNYDQRPTQLFSTKRAAQVNIARWKGQFPNFIKGL